MSTQVRVGPVVVKTDLDLSTKEISRMIRDCTAAAGALAHFVPRVEDQVEKAPVGFSAPVLERLDDGGWPDS